MGSTQSVQVVDESEEDEEEEDDGEENGINGEEGGGMMMMRSELDHKDDDDGDDLMKKVLEQEPEMLCHASASPLSPQLSSLGTPRLGPSIKVWDPYNVLTPPPPHHHHPIFSRHLSSNNNAMDAADDTTTTTTEVFLISHGECELNLRPDLVGGRCPLAALTPNGQRQARALAVFLNSQRVTFNAVYSSPLDRARSMAVSVSQEMNFPVDQIQTSNALADMSQGQWEGCSRSEIYTAEVLSLIDGVQPDFSAPSGESLRQVEFQMVHFLNGTVLGFPEKLRAYFPSQNQIESQGFSHRSTHASTNSMHYQDGPSLPPPQWDLLNRQRQGLLRKKSGKSRLQVVTTTGGHEVDEEISPSETSLRSSPQELSGRISSFVSCVGIFSHAVPIKCLLTGILGCSPVMSHKICIEDSSVTVLQHSWRTGWQIKRLNDTAHLRLM